MALTRTTTTMTNAPSEVRDDRNCDENPAMANPFESDFVGTSSVRLHKAKSGQMLGPKNGASDKFYQIMNHSCAERMSDIENSY